MLSTKFKLLSGRQVEEVEARQMYLLLLQISSLSFIHAWNHTLLECRPDPEAAAAGRGGLEQVCRSPAHQGPQLLYGMCSFAARWATTLQWND